MLKKYLLLFSILFINIKPSEERGIGFLLFISGTIFNQIIKETDLIFLYDELKKSESEIRRLKSKIKQSEIKQSEKNKNIYDEKNDFYNVLNNREIDCDKLKIKIKTTKLRSILNPFFWHQRETIGFWKRLKILYNGKVSN
jgi:hypothetical protein